ncbi:MAG: hypothetical protein Aurels2KO_33980 [Aureliella sp.]
MTQEDSETTALVTPSELPASFMDVQSQEVRLTVDTLKQNLSVQVNVLFRLPPEQSTERNSIAQPLFDLVPAVRRYRVGQSGAWIDGDFPTRRVDRLT